MIAEANRSAPRVHSDCTHSDFAYSPRIVFYEFTRACAQRSSDPDELTPALSKALVDQLTEFPKPPRLVLMGGNPPERADLYGLIEHAFDSGLEVAITLPAAPLVTNDAIDRMRDSGMARLVVTLNGSTATTHDATCDVPGSFACTLRIIEFARSRGIPVEVNTILTQRNLGQIEAMADLLAGRGIVLWLVLFLVPAGRADAANCLSGEQCEQAFESLWQRTRRATFAIRTMEAPHYQRFVLQQSARKENGSYRSTDGHYGQFAPAGLNGGKGMMFVSHAGLIQPSGFLPVVCGMFPFNHVVDVYQNSPILRKLRDANLLQGKCRACEYRHICGGSRARAYAATNNLYAQAPDCLYVPLSLR